MHAMTQAQRDFRKNLSERATAPRLKGVSEDLRTQFITAFASAVKMLGYRRDVYPDLYLPDNLVVGQLKNIINASVASLVLRRRRVLEESETLIRPGTKFYSFFMKKKKQSFVWRLRLSSLFLSAKRAVTCLGDGEKDAVLRKHADCMTVVRPTDNRTLELLSSFTKVKLREFAKTYDFRPNTKPLSSHGTLEVSRAKGGARRFFKQLNCTSPAYLMKRWCSYKYDLERGEVGPSHTFGNILSELELERINIVDSPLPVKAVPLDPANMKIRVITVGSAEVHAIEPVQRFLLDFCKSRYPALVSPVHCNLIQDKLGPLKKEEYFVSGDFEAATDNIHMDCTQTMMLSLFDVVPFFERYRELCMKEVGSHLITYPDGSSRLQVNGQLMGSLLSFPLLCILNDFAYCRVYKNDNKIINGDDIVFKSSLQGYRDWCESCRAVGLLPSAGKNYVSRDFLQINNKLYFPNRRGTCFRQVPLIYTDLLLSRWNVGEIGPVFDTIFEDFPVTPRRVGQFIAHHRKTLQKTPQSLLLPVELGGLSTTGFLDLYKYKPIHRMVYDVLSCEIPQDSRWNGFSSPLISQYMKELGFKKTVHSEHNRSCVTDDKLSRILGRILGVWGLGYVEPGDPWSPSFSWFIKRFAKYCSDRRAIDMVVQPPIQIHQCWCNSDHG